MALPRCRLSSALAAAALAGIPCAASAADLNAPPPAGETARGVEADSRSSREIVEDWRRETLRNAIPADDWRGAMRVGRILGADLVSLDGVRLGSVADIALGPGPDSRFVMVTPAGSRESDSRLVAIPWQRVRVLPAPYRDVLVLDADASSLARAPAVGYRRFDNAMDDTWRRAANRYWLEEAG